MKMVPLTNGGWRIPKETLWARKIAKRSKVVCRVVASSSKKKNGGDDEQSKNQVKGQRPRLEECEHVYI